MTNLLVDVSGILDGEIGDEVDFVTPIAQLKTHQQDALDGDLPFEQQNFGEATEVTISAGVIEIDRSHHTIDTESNAASDNLLTINGGQQGDKLYLRLEDATRKVTVKHAADNIYFSSGQDYELDDANKTLALFHNGTAWTDIGAGGSGGGSSSIGMYYRSGLKVTGAGSEQIHVLGGELTVDGVLLALNQGAYLEIGTGSNWINGSDASVASQYVHVYVDKNGNIKAHNKLPNYPRPTTASRVATMQVNQSGWNGTLGSGLGATTVVYDNDTDESAVYPGCLVGVYTENTFSQGRGKGSGASGGVGEWTWCYVASIVTGSNQIILARTNAAADQGVAFFDNDWLLVVDPGPLVYRLEGSTWWRYIGSIWNDASGDLSAVGNGFGNYIDDGSAQYRGNESSDYTTTSTSFTNIDSTNLVLPIILTEPAPVFVSFHGNIVRSTAGQRTHFDVEKNSSTRLWLGYEDGIIAAGNPENTAPGTPIAIPSQPDANVPPGLHRYALQWKVSTGTGKLYAGAGTSGADMHPTFSIRRGN